MSTHIGASREDISNIVLMPGDPMRAKMIAEKYLTNANVLIFSIIKIIRGITIIAIIISVFIIIKTS